MRDQVLFTFLKQGRNLKLLSAAKFWCPCKVNNISALKISVVFGHFGQRERESMVNSKVKVITKPTN